MIECFVGVPVVVWDNNSGCSLVVNRRVARVRGFVVKMQLGGTHLSAAAGRQSFHGSKARSQQQYVAHTSARGVFLPAARAIVVPAAHRARSG